MDMDVKFIKPAQMVLCIILFLSLFVPYYLVKTVDEDNVTQVDVTASATSAWAVDNTFVCEDWWGVGPVMRYKGAAGDSTLTPEAATIAYSAGSYSYTVTSTTNTVSDKGWGLGITTSKKAYDHLVKDGATDIWVNLSFSTTNNDIRGKCWVRAFGEYDSDKSQHEYVDLGMKDFHIASTNLNETMRFKYRSDPVKYAHALGLCQSWGKDVQVVLYFYFYSNYNPDASDVMLITLDTEDVDSNDNAPNKVAGLLALVGVIYFVVGAAMTSAFNPLGELIKKLRNHGFFFVLLAALMIIMMSAVPAAAGGDDYGEDEKGDDPWYDIATYVVFGLLGLIGALCAAASNIMRLADESSATKIGYLFV